MEKAKTKIIERPRCHGRPSINFKRLANEANTHEEAKNMDMPTLCDCGKWVEHDDMVESPIEKGTLICTECKQQIEADSDLRDKPNWFDSPY